MTIWGKSIVNPNIESREFIVNAIACPGVFFTGAGWKLKSFEIYIKGAKGSDELRLAVYRGGNSYQDMRNATLVEDLFLTNAGAAADTWWVVTSALKPTFNSGELIWLCFKANDGTFPVAYDSVDADRGDLSTFPGARKMSVLVSNDELAAWPATIGDVGADSFQFFNVRINVDVEASVPNSLIFQTGTDARATIAASAASTLTFSTTASTNSARFSRAASSLIFTTSSGAQVTRLASCAATLTFANNATPDTAPNPCWDSDGCSQHAFAATGTDCHAQALSACAGHAVSIEPRLTVAVSERS